MISKYLKSPKNFRRIVQYVFVLTIMLIGVLFTIWTEQLKNGLTPSVERPPGVEGFLPISALMSINHWVQTGHFNLVHPASIIILLMILGLSLVFKKVFCSHICPFGLLSEYLAELQKKIFGRYFDLPRWLDYPLRSLKYLLLLFFVWAIFVQMDIPSMQSFIYSPYNKVADIKMYMFFAEPSALTIKVILALILLSILVRNFWCRFLCPYGALLGITSLFSIFKIRRNKQTCIDCEKCTKVCPVNINVHKTGTVISDECHACLKCVDACPVKDTMYFSVTKKSVKLNRKWLPLIVVIVFLAGSLLARGLGVWQNNLTIPEYQELLENIDSYDHNRGQF